MVPFLRPTAGELGGSVLEKAVFGVIGEWSQKCEKSDQRLSNDFEYGHTKSLTKSFSVSMLFFCMAFHLKIGRPLVSEPDGRTTTSAGRTNRRPEPETDWLRLSAPCDGSNELIDHHHADDERGKGLRPRAPEAVLYLS